MEKRPIFNYNQSHYLSKMNNRNRLFYIKDTEFRNNLNKLLEATTSVAYTDIANKIEENNTDLVTSDLISSYIIKATEKTVQALTYIGISETDPSSNKVIINQEIISTPGSIVSYQNKEYLYDGNKWCEVGDENLYLSKNEAINSYINNQFKILGLNLNSNISVETLKEKLELKRLSYIDRIKVHDERYLNKIKDLNYTPEGIISNTITESPSEMIITNSYTTKDDVFNGSTEVSGKINFNNQEKTSTDYIVSGTIGDINLTVNATSAKKSFVLDPGEVATLTKEKIVLPQIKPTSIKVAPKTTLISSIEKTGEDDDEMLVFSNAPKTTVIESINCINTDNISTKAATLTGGSSIQVENEGSNVVKGIKSLTIDKAPNFKGGHLNSNFKGNKKSIKINYSGKLDNQLTLEGKYNQLGLKESISNLIPDINNIMPAPTIETKHKDFALDYIQNEIETKGKSMVCSEAEVIEPKEQKIVINSDDSQIIGTTLKI